MTAPLWTLAPVSASRPATVPDPVGGQGLLHLHRLEDDDQVAGLVDLPGRRSTATFTMVPSHGGDQGVLAGRRGPTSRLGALGRRAAATGRRGPGTTPRPAGRVTSRRRRPTSTTTRLPLGRLLAAAWRPPAGAATPVAAARPRSSRVWTANGPSTDQVGRRAPPARWNGMRGGHALDRELVEGPAGALQGLARGSAPVTISLASSESQAPPITLTRPPRPASSADARGRSAGRKRVTVPGAGRKPRPGSSPLMRNSTAWPRGAGVGREPSRSPAAIRNMLPDQVDPGDLLGDRVLDLEPGVDLQEGESCRLVADQELDRARADVAGLGAAVTAARRTRPRAPSSEQAGRRGLLDQLLVPPLERAVAVADHDHRAVRCRPSTCTSTWRGWSR